MSAHWTWTAENVSVQSCAESQATAMALDCTGDFVLLAGRRGIDVLHLADMPSCKPQRVRHKSTMKWDISVAEWNPHLDKKNQFVTASNQTADVFTQIESDYVQTMSLKAHTRTIRMRRHSIAEFSHRVSLLNERENLELRRTMSNLTLARRHSLQSFETEILKVKLKAKKLNLNVMDYNERKQGLNYRYEEAEKRVTSKEDKQIPSSQKSRRHSVSNEQRRVTFQEDDVQESNSRSVQRALSDICRLRSGGWTALTRPPSRSLSDDFLCQGKPVRYPKTKEMMVNSYIRNNSTLSKTSRTPSPRKQPSLKYDAYQSSSVSYDDMQSPYKVLQCIGKRSVSAIDSRDSSSSLRRRKFLVTPTGHSSSSPSRPRTAGSNSTS